jgi:hypothetical protein
VILLEGVTNSKYGTFLTTKMNISAENLENAKAAHPPMVCGEEVTGKREEADAPRF